MLKKTFAAVATLGLSISIFGGSAYAQTQSYTQSKLESAQYEKELKEYNAKEEVQLASNIQDSSLKEIKAEKKELMDQVENLSDDEFNRFLYNIAKDNSDTIKEKQKKLDLLDVEFRQEEKRPISTMAITNPTKIWIGVYDGKRGGQDFYHIGVAWQNKEVEKNPATLDVVSIEWDPKYGKFYTASSTGDGITTKRDGSNRDKGIYLFNVNDSKKKFDSYATVQVTRKKAGWLEYGAKYTHTYSTKSKSTTGQAGINFNKGGSSGGYSYSVTKTTNISSWPRYDENAVNIKPF
ncbi:hypothetical protein O0Q50_23345 [Priestia aryabhattai]|uniref:Uncharacterized protein n=1 Tax=Priestia aryabhattai TaxID=412384 RepID=A0AAX6NDX7_PRIAR|nr:hypothetical protein [Priestia aryabhattai]MDU9694123.1 hypothetical protein [Priestia aryabhattai]